MKKIKELIGFSAICMACLFISVTVSAESLDASRILDGNSIEPSSSNMNDGDSTRNNSSTEKIVTDNNETITVSDEEETYIQHNFFIDITEIIAERSRMAQDLENDTSVAIRSIYELAAVEKKHWIERGYVDIFGQDFFEGSEYFFNYMQGLNQQLEAGEKNEEDFWLLWNAGAFRRNRIIADIDVDRKILDELPQIRENICASVGNSEDYQTFLNYFVQYFSGVDMDGKIGPTTQSNFKIKVGDALELTVGEDIAIDTNLICSMINGGVLDRNGFDEIVTAIEMKAGITVPVLFTYDNVRLWKD